MKVCHEGKPARCVGYSHDGEAMAVGFKDGEEWDVCVWGGIKMSCNISRFSLILEILPSKTNYICRKVAKKYVYIL